MKRLFALLTLVPCLAMAAGWGLTRSYGTYSTEAACKAAAASQPAGTYLCSNVQQSSVTTGPGACPASPAPSQVVQCVAPAVGSWTQTRTVTSAPSPTCWTTSAWSPTAPPAGACTTPPTTGVTYDTRVGLGADVDGVPLLKLADGARYVYQNPAKCSDSNDGLAPDRAKCTPGAGWSALRDGTGDWLLMASGQSSAEGFGSMAPRKGFSAAYPIVVTTYDPANPTRLRQGLATVGTAPTSDTYMNDAAGLRVVVENIVFDKRDNSAASVLLLGAVQRDILFFNVRFNRTQVSIQGDSTNKSAQVKGVGIRRCVFAYGFSGAGHSQGLYLWNTDGAIVEDSVMYHNGWNGTNRDTASEHPDIFKHNAYFGTMTFNTVFRRNVSAAASSHGLQARGGGTIEDNVFAGNPLNLLIGGGDEYNMLRPTGVPYSVKRNVVVGSDPIDSANPRGYGVDMINTAAGGAASDNLIVNVGAQNPPSSTVAFVPHTQLDAPTVANWTNNVIWNWGPNSVQQAIADSNRYPAKLSLTMAGNVHPNDTPTGTNVKAPAVPYPDPSRTIASYAKASGYSSEASFWAYVILHPEMNWAKLIGDYIRAGFGK